MPQIDSTIAPFDGAHTTVRQVFTYTGPASYVAGGDPIDPANLRMGEIFALCGTVVSNGTLILVPYYNATTGKVQFFVPNTGAEATGDLSAYSGRFEAIGKP